MKAIALISGGLDSILAARFMRELGIEIIPLNFKIPFCQKAVKKIDGLSQELMAVDIGADFLEMLKQPEYGYGSHMNPCIDCKILMLRKAKELMPAFGAAFIVTGEVLGQRPMSQHKQALVLIAKKAGLEGLVLRPLSAKLLSETTPEKEGWVEREKLMDFSGRSRKAQMSLAEKFGIKEYAQPAGGCLLTDPLFTAKLKDLIRHEELNLENVELLKLGRHFRLDSGAKLIVGRDEKENARLAGLAKDQDYLFMPAQTAGPTALGRGVFNDGLIQLSAAIVSRYCDRNGNNAPDIIYRQTGTAPVPRPGSGQAGDCPCLFKAPPIEESILAKLRV